MPHISHLTSHISHLTSHISHNHGNKNQGFTLSEVLITLGIIGLLATFVISNLIHNLEEKRNSAIYKETFASFSEIFYNGYLEGRSFSSREQAFSYLQSKLDYELACPNNTLTQGCRSTTAQHNWQTRRGFKLKNGAVVMMDMHIPSRKLWINLMIDVNGDAPPNTGGQDILLGGCNMTLVERTIVVQPAKPGQCVIHNASKHMWLN